MPTLHEALVMLSFVIGFTLILTAILYFIDAQNNAKKEYEIYQDNHGFFIKVFSEYKYLKMIFKDNFIIREDIPSIEKKPLDESITRIKYFSLLEEAENYIKKISNPTKLIKKIS